MDCGYLNRRATLIEYTTYKNEYHEICEGYKKLGTFWCNIKNNGYKKTRTDRSKLENDFLRASEDVFIFTVVMRKYKFCEDVQYIVIGKKCYKVLELDQYKANDTVTYICETSDLNLSEVID